MCLFTLCISLFLEALPKRKRSGFSLKRRPASGSNLVGLLDNLKSMTENIKTKAASKGKI